MSIASLPPVDFSRYLTQHARHFGFGEQLIVGANEDGGDGPLHVDRLGDREEARQLGEASRASLSRWRPRVSSARTCAGEPGIRVMPLATSRSSPTSAIGRCPRKTSAI